MTSLRISNAYFSYPIFEITGRSLKVTVMRQVAGAKLILGAGYAKVEALSDVSLSLNEGDRLGLIGHNGSGKSTLLRLIAGLAHPEKGSIEVRGKVVPLLDKGMGINPELSGRENIELPLRLLGASSDEIKTAMEEIPDWTGLGPFINLPFRTYSDGMKARLSFALCTAVSGDILVLDEWLGAGDAAFVEQAEMRLTNFINKNKTLVLASHSLTLVENVCTLAAWMERGRLVMFGPTNEVVSAYRVAMHSQAVVAAE